MQISKSTNNQISAFSLLEILVTVAIFAILGILITQSIVLTISGSKKSESLVQVRQNLDYSIGIIERQLRNANAVPVCPNPDTSKIDYTDQNGNPASFSCVNVGQAGDAYVASGSARLTSDSVIVTTCSFSCNPSSAGNPPYITISLKGVNANAVGLQNSFVSADTTIYLRNY